MNGRRKIMGCLLLGGVLLAGPAMAAGPVDGWGWTGWLAGAWSSLVDVFASSEVEEPAPVPVPPAKGDEPTSNTNSCPTCGGGEGDSLPGLDPDGKP